MRTNMVRRLLDAGDPAPVAGAAINDRFSAREKASAAAGVAG
jgi:hypothetical protein